MSHSAWLGSAESTSPIPDSSFIGIVGSPMPAPTTPRMPGATAALEPETVCCSNRCWSIGRIARARSTSSTSDFWVRSPRSARSSSIAALSSSSSGHVLADMTNAVLASILLDQVRLLVVRVRHVGRDVGMLAEERHVELLDGHPRVAHPLDPDARQVQVEVPAEHPERLGVGRPRSPRSRGCHHGSSRHACRGPSPPPTPRSTRRGLTGSPMTSPAFALV